MKDQFLKKDGTQFHDAAVQTKDIFYDGKHYYTIKNKVKYTFHKNMWMEN